MVFNYILNSNKLIAEFMGGYYYSDVFIIRHNEILLPYYGLCDLDKLRYCLSWDWLMPVIDKIEELNISEYSYKWNDDKECNFMSFVFDMNHTSNGYSASIYMELQLDPPSLISGGYLKIYDTRINAAYNCVVDFIKWYNNLTNETNETK